MRRGEEDEKGGGGRKRKRGSRWMTMMVDGDNDSGWW